MLSMLRRIQAMGSVRARRRGILLVLSALVWLPVPATATTISRVTLAEGNTILQVAMAAGIETDGGLATADIRTVYFYSPDFGDAAPNEHDFVGSTWPYVFVDGALEVESGITASVTTATTAAGDIVLVNGNPLYQFVGDSAPGDANGNFGPWFYVQPDGSATQDAVPEPAALTLMAAGLLALAGMRRGRRA